ncbi:hypothetical protein [Rhizobium sp. RCC_161_2]|uniref:hypothetical protein n=1 Tax=Rhizobium sp. RCC_161_2 TaxID=3239219 RepID=UPI0035242343
MIGAFRDVSFIAIAIGFTAVNCMAADIPSFWRKTMTNDPATNWFLSEAMKPLPNKNAEILRIYKLGGVFGSMCAGARIDKAVGNAFLKTSGYSGITGKEYEDAAFLADDQFRYFDFRTLAHLCAGSDYMFGPQGHLIPNLIKGAKGEPNISYDRTNPYIRLPSISTAPHPR